MLLIDGVKYHEWTPEKEVEEFHPLVREHVQEIFGTKSKFIEGSRLQSVAKKGSEPDGFVLVFGNEPQWHIVEMELSCHQLYDHIVNQVGRFINGIENSRKRIIDVIYHEITENKVVKAEVEELIGSGEIYKFLTDLISKPPILTIIIENKTQELEEALNLLRYSPIKIVEFRTFVREGAESVHAHLFEPLYHAPPKKVTVPETAKEEMTPPQKIELIIWPASRGRLNISKNDRSFLPDYGERFTIATDKGEFNKVSLYKQKDEKDHFHLKEWAKAHPELKRGDKVTLEAIEDKKKYRLEILR